jgi:pimeloyl-ACP methyl ester carboxylesterase
LASFELVTKSIRNVDTSWLEGGKKGAPLMLFLHGFPDVATTWQNQMDHFSKSYYCIAPYARGVGQSAWVGESRASISSMILDLLEIIAVVDPKGKRKVTVISHDLGGPLSWELARHIGESLNALITINTASFAQMKKRIMTRKSQVLKSWYTLPFTLPGTRNFSRAFMKKRIVSQKKSSEHVDPELMGIFHYRTYLKEVLKTNYRRQSKVKKPVLVLFGNNDKYLVPPRKDEVEIDCTDFTIRVIEGDHWMHENCPSVVNELIEEFLC